jgi:hypothetical protein
MISAQKRIIDFCDKLLPLVKKAEVSKILEEKISALVEEVRNRELVVPVVGSFSAGKSTLINNCIGTKILPEAVTPETSLATELHYSKEEYAVAVRKDGSEARYSTSEMEKLTKDAPQYQYAKLYLNRPVLQEIEPIVLVDMPGFDSPLDAHNKAIMAYLERGCYYVVLSSVEEGTVTKSLLRHLRELNDLDRKFSFFLSKSNLRPPKTIQELVSHYQDVLNDNLDEGTFVTPLDNNSGIEVVKQLRAIDTDGLFLSLYQEQLKALCYEFIELINTLISSSKKETEKNLALVAEMESSIQKLQKKTDELVQDVEQRYSKVAVNDLVNAVGSSLERSIDELVSVAISGNQEETSRRLNEIVRSTLTSAIKSKLGDLNTKIANDYVHELQGLDSLMKSDYGTDGFISAISGTIQNMFNKSSEKNPISPTAAKAGFKALTGILAITTSVLAPVVEVIIFMLPEILGPFFKGIQERKQKEALRTKFQTEIFPQVKQKIRSEMPTYLDTEIKVMITNIRDQYQEKIEQQQQAVKASIESAKLGAEETKKKQAEFEATLVQANALVNEIA